MKLKIISIYLITVLFLIMQVTAIDYSKTTGDSLFVVGVDWQKDSTDPTSYNAYITVDLNYGLYSNPLNRYAIVEQYFWNNWWSSSAQFGDVGTIGAGINTSDEYYIWQQLDFYYELPDITPGSEADDYQCNVLGYCGDIVPTTRIGYYGLPFYIQILEFVCDDEDNNKGGITLIPDDSDIDIITLTRPDYDGIPNAEITVETSVVPLGFGTRPSEIVRYNGIPDKCKNMDTTSNSRLSFVLKPNSLYRHVDPNIEGSEEWEYGSIISLLPSVLNSETLPFNLDIGFNFSTNFWDYEIDTASELQAFEDAYFSGQNFDMLCTVETLFGIEQLYFKELTTQQQLQVNTGSGINCMYPKDPTIQNLNNKRSNDIIEAISFQQQREVVLQLDLLEKKLLTKKFVTKSIIPFFVIIIVLIFYVLELILLGIVFLGLIPMMFNQMRKGMKDVFDIDHLIHEEKRKRGLVRRK